MPSTESESFPFSRFLIFCEKKVNVLPLAIFTIFAFHRKWKFSFYKVFNLLWKESKSFAAGNLYNFCLPQKVKVFLLQGLLSFVKRKWKFCLWHSLSSFALDRKCPLIHCLLMPLLSPHSPHLSRRVKRRALIHPILAQHLFCAQIYFLK